MERATAASRGRRACPFRHSRGSSGTEIPGQKRQRGGRSARRRPERSGFGNQIQCVKKVADELTEFGAFGLYRPAKVGPSLVVRGVPEGLGGGRPPMGLSSLSNSQDTPPEGSDGSTPDGACSSRLLKKRHGLDGMSAKGRRFIGDFCLLTDQIRKRMAMWTVNLEEGWILDLKDTGQWPLFQRRLIDHLTQLLVEAGDPAVVLGVVELSPKRGERTGRPYPHLHIVTSGYGARGKGGGWLIGPKVMDELVIKALASCGIRVEGLRAASNVEQIRQSVAAYLRAYLKKQVDLPSVDTSDGWIELIPRQWWNRSAAARALVDGHYFQLPPEFVYWMLAQRTQLEAMKLGFGGVSVVGERRTLTGFRPIEIEYFRFWSPAAIARAIELFCLYERDPCLYSLEVRACLGGGDLDRQNAEHARAFKEAARGAIPNWLDILRVAPA